MTIKLTRDEAEQMFRAVAMFSENYAEACGVMTNEEINTLEKARLKIRKQVIGF